MWLTLPQLRKGPTSEDQPFSLLSLDSFGAVVLCHAEVVELLAARVIFHPIITIASA